MTSKMTAADLFERIVAIRDELDFLCYQIGEAIPPEDGGAPDTEHLLCRSYICGPPTGVDAAKEALEDITLDDCTAALEPAAMQRQRVADREAKQTPEYRKLVEAADAAAQPGKKEGNDDDEGELASNTAKRRKGK